MSRATPRVETRAPQVLDLRTKAREHIKTLFESPENEVESLRLKTDFYARLSASGHARRGLTIRRRRR